METSRTRSQVLGQYFAVTWVVVVLNMIPFLTSVALEGPLSVLYAGAVHLTYAAIYLLPPLLVALGVNALLSWRALGGRSESGRDWRTAVVYCAAVAGFASVQVFIRADERIHEIFGYHFNGFVLNLLTTPGGIDSLGGDETTTYTAAAMAVAFVALQAALLFVVLRALWFRRAAETIFRRRRMITVIVLASALSLTERVAYAVSYECDYVPVLTVGGAFPFYQGLRLHLIGSLLGTHGSKYSSIRMKAGTGCQTYPLAPIRQGPHERWNIVWLACESLRADSLNPLVMPALSDFAKRSSRFDAHISAGNGTRMGMFGMFYGLYGPYWFTFLSQTRGPVLLDVLRKDGYQMRATTSAAFTYPEFDRTIFAEFPAEELHVHNTGTGWVSDRANVTDLLAGIDARDPSKPFFSFMFFESPHARYDFPPESAVCKPYLESLNYATMDLKGDIGLIRNRYLNACNHLDSQLARIIRHLDETGLMDKTIVIVTGDHGEEFMEKGRWGHNSTYAEEQIHTPLVIHVPGRAPEVVTRLTSHLDVAPTVMTLLGVENPPSDYSLGYDLFGTKVRDYTVVSQWSDVAYVDADVKVVFPIRTYGYCNQTCTTRADAPLPDRERVLAAHAARFAELARDLGRFAK